MQKTYTLHDLNDIEIPSVFYSHVLSGSASLSLPVRFWSLAQMILQQALRQLDPQRLGLYIRVVRCMPAGIDAKVHSLRMSLCIGTPPWDAEREDRLWLLGAESLAGWAISNRHSVVIAEPGSHPHETATHSGHEACAAAYPIERAGRIAGCLLLSSMQPGYFTAARLMLIRHYADLLALAFEPDEFYCNDQVDLRVMPAPEYQLTHLTTFRSRVADVLASSMQDTQLMDVVQAELLVWQQFEAEFLQTTS